MSNGLRTVTLGILGTGDISHELACDALNDHFGFGPEDSDGYFTPSDRYSLRLILPVTAELTTQGVQTVWQWAMRCELQYTALTDGTSNEFTGAILDNVAEPADIQDTSDVAMEMIDRLRDADHPMLLILSGKDGQVDELTQAAAAEALMCDMPVHDLSRALLEIGWEELPDRTPPEPQPQEPALVTEDDGQVALALSTPDGPDVLLTKADLGIISAAIKEVEGLLGTLDGVMHDQVPLLRQALHHARAVLLPKPEPVPASAATGKTRLEIFNEETGQWEAAGRGRPKAGVPKRRVPVPAKPKRAS